MNSIPTTFSQIFGQKLNDNTIINAIEVPIIQRDYAQGRQSKEVARIRDQFIDTLYKAIINPEEDAVKLDFVYGNIEGGKLIPLDGQQRLTTLFLLHWYTAKQEGIAPGAYAFLNNFTYRTRFSSQHFCEKLVACTPDFNEDNLSNWISDQNWFMYSWEKDPTIKAMLVMIDKLHRTFKGSVNLWEKLLDKKTPAISFYFLPLEDMGVTDSLYIKMNSRGKPLTPFEHFKADFEKTILKVSNNLHAEFVQKVDVNWVDMLWKYRGTDEAIDAKFMKIYRFITEMICFQQDIVIVENDFELANSVYSITNSKSEENLRTLFDSLDKWQEIGDIQVFFDSIFTSTVYQENKTLLFSDQLNLFALCCNLYGVFNGKRRAFSLNNTLLLFAVQQYVLHTDTILKEDFIERLRIARNLVFNSPDEIRESRLQALLDDVSSIIKTGSIILGNSGFNELQKKQEQEKQVWRKENTENTTLINQLEDHRLLQGNIAIVGLHTSSVFKKVANNFNTIFNGTIAYTLISNVLLSIGDYGQQISWRTMYGNTNDSTWKELFTQSKKKRFFEKTKNVLFKLLNTESIITTTYLTVVLNTYKKENTLKDWRYYIINYPIMRSGGSGIYVWRTGDFSTKENQYEIWMMNTFQSLGGRHWDPFLYALSINLKYKSILSLEEYGKPLVLKPANQKIECKNDHWAIYDNEYNLIKKILVKQENNIDMEDRYISIENYLNTFLITSN